jgi:DNA (cytosine-5)-methyltransferase 1
MKLRVFTAFSGYDSQCLALDRLGIDYELVGWSEIDKYAIQAHNALFPQWADRNFGDISKIDWSQVPDFDLFTYSSPCQDFSNAGKMAGGEEGSGTRSSLLWECRRAIEAKRPKYCLMENVANLVSKKFIHLFNKWQLVLDGFGYTNFAKVLNSKYYGVPQNRERIFLVSIIREAAYKFPSTFKLDKLLKDVLWENVDEKYYLSEKTILSLAEHCARKQSEGCGFKFEPTYGNCVAKALSTREGSRHTDNYIIVPEATAKGYAEAYEGDSINLKLLNSKTRRGRVGKQIENTLDTGCQMGVVENNRIRKLTPRECFRLMGVDDSDIDKIQAAGISDTQQYKLAGNSIVVDVLYHIFRKMFIDNETDKTTLF